MTELPAELWPEDLAEVLYVDHYGNAVTGLRGGSISPAQQLQGGRQVVKYARVFAESPAGTAFWYENANGLVEIAVNLGNAAATLGLQPGDPVTLL